MDITTSFRHVDTSEDVRQYVEEKLSRLQKYVETPLDIHVVISLERKYRQRIDVMFTINGVVINAHEVMDDIYAAIDKILDKLERRLTKYRDKVKAYRENKSKRPVLVPFIRRIRNYCFTNRRCETHGSRRSGYAASGIGRSVSWYFVKRKEIMCVLSIRERTGNSVLLRRQGRDLEAWRYTERVHGHLRY